jgi:hypothetical protein
MNPNVSTEKYINTLAHELHHIGMFSIEKQYHQLIEGLPEWPAVTAKWLGAFGEGFAMLAAAGGPDLDPHAASSEDERAVWARDMSKFESDFKALEQFFFDINTGRYATAQEADARGMTFYGSAQGAWYTVGYRMAVMVEKGLGRQALLETMLDPRLLLVRYNRLAAAQNQAGGPPLPLWSEAILAKIQANDPDCLGTVDPD